VLLAVAPTPTARAARCRFSLGHTSTDADVDACRRFRAGVERARRAGRAVVRRARRDERGVDSPSPRRWPSDAGPRRHPASTSHCPPDRQTLPAAARRLLQRRGRPRPPGRVADELGIPFYVWDLAERFREDVVDDFVAEYAAGRTPNPCLRCNEKIKFSAGAATGRSALGFDAVVTGPPRPAGRRVLRRSVDAAKDQSYVLAVLTAPDSWPGRSSRSGR
jgi:hypothetical protein